MCVCVCVCVCVLITAYNLLQGMFLHIHRCLHILPHMSYIYNRKTIFQEKTVNITQLTHTHPLAIVGAILQSFAVQLALSLDNSQPLDTSAFLDELLDRLRPVEKEIYDSHKQTKKEKNQEEEKSGDERYLLFKNVVGRTVLCWSFRISLSLFPTDKPQACLYGQIQTHKRFKRTLFIWTKHEHIFWVIRLRKLQNDT